MRLWVGYAVHETIKTDALIQFRKMGSRKTIVIVCEGAIDKHLNPIKAEQVKKVLEEKLKLDTRVTTLGHIQRGGVPCAVDRFVVRRIFLFRKSPETNRLLFRVLKQSRLFLNQHQRHRLP